MLKKNTDTSRQPSPLPDGRGAHLGGVGPTQIESMLNAGKVKLEYVRGLLTREQHIVQATRAPKLMPEEHQHRTRRSMVKTPWCAFYDLTHRCWQLVLWKEIIKIVYRKKTYNHVEK